MSVSDHSSAALGRWSVRRALVAPATAMAPPVAYTLAHRLGLWAAVLCGVTVAMLALVAERRLTGRRRWSWLGVAGIALSAALALLTGNALLFFVRSIVLRGLWGVVFVGSALVGRPVLAIASGWLMPPEIAQREAMVHGRAFSFVTMTWGIVELLKAAIRGYAMATSSLDRFTVVLLMTGYPVEVTLAVFAVWYLRRAGVSLQDETGVRSGA